MGNQKSMVSYNQIGTLMDKQKGIASILMGQSLYENGMVEVLREVAYLQMEKLQYDDVTLSPAAKDAAETAGKLYESLADTLTPEQKELLIQLEDARTYHFSLENEDHFISGFVHGYAQLKQITKNKKSPL